ncbi:hypothetical protein HW090_13165 [Pseudomonas sp. ABC1]|uniref:hypothetical protein n=1 Tax=Pseudomonas sp. ABC1 TaxID=2748080 RepID=UPI0015C3FC77|nr:hypothetical protein [Pseudomonas sp. ABC1]QLF94093.1 hypothetical protein HW090_13165 [Pseudomonas sp. ABC1]
MNLIACDGQLATDSDGYIRCTGTLHVVASDQIAGTAGLTPDDSAQLYDAMLQLFATVFIFLVLKRLIR